MSKETIFFIYNPASGQGKIKSCLSDVIDMFIKAGFEVVIYATQAPQDALKQVEAQGDRFDRIICCGGDGTLDEVVTGVMRAHLSVPIGYLPAGSANDFGSSLGIGLDILQAAGIAANGQLYPCDVGHFNEDYFVYVAAFGLFTEASYATSQDLKNLLGYLAYIVEGARELMDVPSYALSVDCDGEVFSGDYLFGMVTNSVYIGGVEGLIAQDVNLDDGIFEVTLIAFPKNPIELAEILGYFTGINRDTKLVYSRQAKHISFSFEKAVPWTLDGEFGGEFADVEIEVLPQALNLLV